MAGIPEGSRMGWEVEFHKIKISWRRQGDNLWWPTTQANFDTWGKTLAPDGTSIFIPADLGANLAAPGPPPAPVNVPAFGNENAINWTGLWGFRVVQDAAGSGNNGNPVRGECIIEVNTSAQLLTDYHYWFWAQTCLRLLHTAITTYEGKLDGSGVYPAPVFYRVHELLDRYNSMVRTYPMPAGVNDLRRWFGLKLSDRLTRFMAGNPVVPLAGAPGHNIPNNEVTGVHWETWFAVGLPTAPKDYCDVQINYSVKLGWLSQNLGPWITCWGGMWTHKLGATFPDLDPDVGDLPWSMDDVPPNNPFRKKLTNPTVEVYRTQLYAAAWRTAENWAGQLLTDHIHVAYQALPAMDQRLIKGLVIYLLAVGAVTVTDTYGSSKNCTPQLPKSSPAAIANLIRARGHATANVMTSLADNTVAAAAHAIVTNRLRVMNELQNAPGNLPAGRPQTAVATLNAYPDEPANANMYRGVEPPGFEQMWRAAFNPPAQAAGPVNPNYGLSPDAPFNCKWADDVQTGIAPVVQASDTDILIGFESRYNACILNLGFNPKVRKALFTKSYLTLLQAVTPGPANTAAATALIGREFGWDAIGNAALHIPVSLERNLAAGIH